MCHGVSFPVQALLKNASRTRTQCHAHPELSRKLPLSVNITPLVSMKRTDTTLKTHRFSLRRLRSPEESPFHHVEIPDFHHIRFRSPGTPPFDDAEIKENLQSSSMVPCCTPAHSSIPRRISQLHPPRRENSSFRQD